MSIPIKVREQVKSELWRRAEELDWESLGVSEKARHYSQWTESETIGRVLAAHMDPRAIRVYIKDSLLKSYNREKLNDHLPLVLRLVEHEESDIHETFIKPHGLRFLGGDSVAWGRADDWKNVLGTLFERGFDYTPGIATAVLFKAAPRFLGDADRRVVQDAASRLGISKSIWFD